MKRGDLRRLWKRLRFESDRLCRASAQRWQTRRWRLGTALLLCTASGLVVTCRLLDNDEPARVYGEVPEVRVLLQGDASHVELRLDGDYELRGETGRLLAHGSALRPGILVVKGRGIALNGRSFEAENLRIHPLERQGFTLGGKSYPGDLVVQRDAQGRLQAINHVDMETYVAGVLFSEMPRSFGVEALRAQAVAARSYARWRLSRDNALLQPNEADQMYEGNGPLANEARRIVTSTRGEVLEHDGGAFCSYYSSTCGGGTSAVQLVFSGAPHPAMQGTSCDYCKESPRYRWHRELSLDELARRFGLHAGQHIDEVAQQIDRVGRALSVELRGEGFRRSFGGLEFRARWNATAPSEQKLPGTIFHRLSIHDGKLIVDGGAFGHGVGMCQFGCKGLASTGKDYRQILAHYYRGADVVRRW